MADMKVQGEFEMDTTKGEDALARVESGARRMASTVKQAGDSAANALGGMGDKAEQSAKGMERANAALAAAAKRAISESQRAIVEAQGYNLKSAEGLERLARLRGADVDAISGQLGALRTLRAEQERLTKTLQDQRDVEMRSRQQNEFVNSLQNQVTAIGKTRSELLALQAAQLGVSDKAAPMIARLREQEAGFAKLGASAGQTRAALAQLPMQFSDIVVSLQGGQAPLTVFLQQGAQIKDSFGGAGAALKAMGGYVLGLINPLTLGAAAAAALAVAYNQGSKEAQGYSTAIISTGNAAGTTAAQMTAYAQAVSASVGTQGKAAEAITELVSTGKVAASVLRDAGAAAVYWEQATGQAVSKTAEQFASLRADPLAAVLKLNEGMNFLTESTYRQIKSLSDQGKTADAARVAQEAYADALTGRARQIEQNLGYIETGWKRVKDAAKAGWDAMLNVGRASTPGDALTELRSRLESQQRELAAKRAINPAADTSGLDKGIEVLKQRIGLLESDERQLRRNAEAEAARAAQVQAAAQWDKEGVKYLSDKAKLERDLTQARNEGTAAGKSQAEINERLAKIREEYAKKGGGAAAAKAEQSAYATLIASVKARLEQNEQEIATGAKLNEAQKLRIQLVAQLESGSRKMTAARQAETKASLDDLDASERRLAVAQAQRKFEGERDKENSRLAEEIAKINQKAQALEDEAAVYGKTADELRALTVERLNEQKAMLMGFDGSQQRIDQLNEEIAAVQRLGAAETKIADLKLGRGSDELLANAREQAKIYEDESRLIGLSAVERQKVVALRKVELDYAKRIQEINKSGASDEAKEAARIKALEAKQIESQAAVSKVVEEDWNKTSQLIGDTLADYIMGGGKDAAQYLKRLFATLVLQPVVQMGVGSALGALGGGGAGASGGAGSALSMASNASTIYSLFTGGMASSLGGSIASLGSMFGSSALSSFAAGMQGSTLAAGLMGPTTVGATGAMGAGAGLGSVLGAIPGWGWALAGVGALFGGDIISGLFGRKLKDQGIEGTFGGESDFEGRTYQYYKGGLFRSNKTRYGELDEDLRSGLADQFGALQAGTSEMAKILGLGTDAIDNFTASIKISFNGLDEAGIQNALKAEFEKIAESLSSQTLGTTEFTRNGETAVQTLGRLSGSLSAVNSVFENLSQTLYASSLAGADMASQLVDLFGGADGFNSATGSYFQNFYSEDEQRAAMERQLQAALDKLDLTLPDIDAADARAQWRAQAEALDLTTEAGRKAWAVLIQLSGAFAGITQSAEDAAAAAAAQARQAAASRTKEEDLQIQLLRAQGNELAAVAIERRREMDALAQFGPAAQDIQRHIWAIIDATAQLQAGADAYFADVDRKAAEQGYVNDAQAAIDKMFGSVSAQAQAAAQAQASAAQAAAASWRSAASSIQSSLDKLRADTTAGMDPAARLSLTRAQLGAYTTAALGGDADAASKMASAADAFLQASDVGSITRADYLRDRITAEAQLASVLESSEAKASVQESIAAAANATVSELQALNANLTGFAGALYEILGKGYQGADRGAAQTVAQSFAKMQADYDAYFNDLAGYGKVGNKYTDASFGGASFTKLNNNMAAFTGADGIVSYIRAGESLVEVAKRIPELRGLWEKIYGIKLPEFDVGTNYIPYDMPAMVHKGERIIPAADNRALMSALQNGAGGANAELVNEIRALRAEVASLRAAAAETADNTRNLPQMVDQFDNVTEGGNAIRNNQMNVVAA